MIPAIRQNRFISNINPQTLLFFFHNFFINAGTTLVYVSANVLLLENHPESSLPIAYIAAAAGVMAAGKIYEYFEHHLLLEKLSLGTMASALFLVLVVMGLLWIGHGTATAIAIMVGYRIVYLLINLEFWGLSALVFNVRQSKRLFSVIGSGDMPAKSLGAVLAVVIHSPSVLMILLVISLVFFALAFYTQTLTFKYTEIPNPHHARGRKEQTGTSRLIQKYFSGNKLLTSLCLGMAAIAATATWIEYHFFVNVKYKFHNQHDVIVFVGSLLTATYVISTFVKMLLSGRTVEKFGIRLTLYLLPVVTLLTSVGLLTSSYFRKDEPSLLVYYCLSYLLFEIVRRTIFDPVFLVLFQPLSTKNRLKGHTLAKGLYEPFGMLLAGVLLYVIYTMKWSDISLTLDLSLLFALLALLIFRKAYRHYGEELRNAISKRFIRGGEIASPVEALPIIVQNLKSDKKEEVINAIDWLARYKISPFLKNLDFLLTSKDVQVRFKTLDTFGKTKPKDISQSFYQYIENEPDTTCQTLAVKIACASGTVPDAKVKQYLAHPDSDIVRGALLGGYDSGFSRLTIRETIQHLLSGNDSRRLLALDCIEALHLEGYSSKITECLASQNEAVLKKAIAVAGKVPDPALVAHLVPMLAGKFSKQVLGALTEAGNLAVPLLEEWMATKATEKELILFAKINEKSTRHLTSSILLKHLKSIYNPISIDSALSQVSIAVRNAVLKSLANSQIVHPDREWVMELVNKELILANHILHGITSEEADPWNRAMAYELESVSQRLFYLFSILYDKEAVQNAWKGIKHASREKRANSLEMIESLLPRNLYPSLHALFEDIPIQRKQEVLRQYLGTSSEVVPIVTYIVSQKDYTFSAWTLALALHKLPETDSGLVRQFTSHTVTLVREAALDILEKHNKANPDNNPMKTDHTASQISEMERVIVLQNTRLFSETPENVLSSIAPIMKEISYSEGQEIFAKGDPGDSMYVIYAGEVGIYDGNKQLASFEKGEIFGELALLDAEPRSATTVAETDIHLFRIDQDDFFELMEERDEILRNVLRILCQRIRVQNEKMRILSSSQA